MQSNVSFHLEFVFNSNFKLATCLFEGSLLEVMAQLSWMYPRNFTWLLDQFETERETSLLLAAVAFHDHGLHGEYKIHCTLKKILSGGADPNAAGYLVTPLQISVATRDIEGITELLEAGANPNGTGDRDGVCSKRDSLLENLNQLHGLSPLYIHRNSDDTAHYWVYEYRDGCDKSVIEDLLLQHGAREFSTLTEESSSS